MPSLGIGELLVVAIVLLVFVGPERLPHVFRWLGRIYGQIRRAADEMRRAMVLEADRMDEEERLKALRERRLEAERLRKEREAAVAEGVASQRTVLDEAVSKPAPDAPPPGFSAEEWAELPDHIKQIVQQRGGAA
jgi:sec-independent protein translocase protein TatB